ncbi:MAG TPA: hypothetical protein ENI56_01700 [Candidatus Kaiserbacteria bacterium]|nr:hypothetical protein [Candidatus Kaiserbacteria bacterium]
MSIATVYQKCKQRVITYRQVLPTIPLRVSRDGIVVLLFIATTFAGFGLGFIAGENNSYYGKGIRIELPASATTTQNENGGGGGASTLGAQVVPKTTSVGNKVTHKETIVASKNGGRYYLISCAGAKRIHKENKIWFQSPAMAVAKGYTPALNCFGH